MGAALSAMWYSIPSLAKGRRGSCFRPTTGAGAKHFLDDVVSWHAGEGVYNDKHIGQQLAVACAKSQPVATFGHRVHQSDAALIVRGHDCVAIKMQGHGQVSSLARKAVAHMRSVMSRKRQASLCPLEHKRRAQDSTATWLPSNEA